MPLDTERKVYFFEDLEIGLEAFSVHVVAGEDVELFARITGDRNPIHFDTAFAALTSFKTPIAHGLLTAGYISTVYGMELPGPGAIFVGMSINFVGPVRAGDEVIASVRLVGLDAAKRRAHFTHACAVKGRAVLEGTAELMVPRRLATKAA